MKDYLFKAMFSLALVAVVTVGMITVAQDAYAFEACPTTLCPSFTILIQEGSCSTGGTEGFCNKYYDVCTQSYCYSCRGGQPGGGGGL